MTANVDDVARAVLDCVGPVEAMKLEKLVYYSQAWHLAIEDEPLFSEPVEAWRDGPMVDHLYQQHRGARTVHSWPAGDADRLSDAAKNVIRTICGVYGDLSGDDLSQLTHAEGPWVAARRGYRPEQRSRQRISDEAMKSYYRRRKLAGRRPSDLAVGGMHYGVVGLVTDEEVRAIAEEIKTEIRGPRKAKDADLVTGELRDVARRPRPTRH